MLTEYTLINDRKDLSDALGVPLSALTGVLYGKGVDSYYKSFSIPKKSGGVRTIDAPEGYLKHIQRRLALLLWKRQEDVWRESGKTHNITHAFQQGKSIMSNARVHKNKRYVLNVDLEDFFGSIHFGRIKGFFEKNRDFKVGAEAAIAITQIVCYKGRLPQGAPSSPVITNLVCNILDMRILKLARKYKLDYTRYADDLTFSTNRKRFIDEEEKFLNELRNEVNKNGFSINDNKTHFSNHLLRQSVTGLVVNDKVAVKKEFRKETRAMLHNLYTNGEFYINGEKGTIKQIEGRLSFIDQVDAYSKSIEKEEDSFISMSSRQRQYKKFLFYKYFFSNAKPMIITEGESDIFHLKAAIKKNRNSFDVLVKQDSYNENIFKIQFFRMSKKNKKIFDISDGGDKFKSILDLYGLLGNSADPDSLMSWFLEKTGICPINPVIMILDNERKKIHPLGKTLNMLCSNGKYFNSADEMYKEINENGFINLNGNLYLASFPNSQGDVEIEDLYNKNDLAKLIIYGKSYKNHFEKGDGYSRDVNFSKMEFAKYALNNYEHLNFEGFIPLLSVIESIITDYEHYTDKHNCSK